MRPDRVRRANVEEEEQVPQDGQLPPIDDEQNETLERGLLLDGDTEERLRERWRQIQEGFVDEPRRAVTEADALVVDVTKLVTEVFSRERSGLEQQWSRKEEVSTEELRIALQRYRSFFDRLLGA